MLSSLHWDKVLNQLSEDVTWTNKKGGTTWATQRNAGVVKVSRFRPKSGIYHSDDVTIRIGQPGRRSRHSVNALRFYVRREIIVL